MLPVQQARGCGCASDHSRLKLPAARHFTYQLGNVTMRCEAIIDAACGAWRKLTFQLETTFPSGCEMWVDASVSPQPLEVWVARLHFVE
jgi:hypothetical protein